MKIGYLPAFPSHGSMGEVVQDGMTLRQHFSGLAMQAMLSNPNVIGFNQMRGWELVNCSREQLSKFCIDHADALLAELEKPE